MNAVEFIDFNTFYGPKAILQNINVEFASNSITAIIGPSGCGKTTLLRSINRTAEMEIGFKSQGDIKVLGKSIKEYKNVSLLRRRVGMVYQIPVALPLSIRANVLFGPKYYGVKRHSDLEAITEKCLRQVALWDEVKDRLKRPAAQLSGGQKQRLAIARALAVEPQVLLLDEPCSSLDPASTGLIEELLTQLAEGLCIIIVTHNLFQARRISNETAFILDGQLIEKAPTQKLFESPDSPKTRGFVSGLFG
ncbi:MAG: phosphate ABC transporter ATP-binding protein [Syntrophomonadaceae bacterium]|jgi:phosphate transport system ATP-binding protein|nr:phosphate ABC transporter ATP-binding protein [Bacillota bacterium]NLM89313.1 phosphate ABC transporter ATP-binding protein [Syntrophomonadaceae bacterium]HAA09812.1 phosphate ABC transporter ATP-binding protein [Syntrophomonas sp.]HQA49778.1 phosphate ABC transporter ATP-binding protein [Syntrophomonadaceae bacterium]HQD90801.1 phosphate ABC transporter ATP-binding protein [Syntrophomonadaceae bacterium]